MEGSHPPNQVSNEKLGLQLQSSCYFTKCSCFLLFDSNDQSLKHFQLCGVCVCVCKPAPAPRSRAIRTRGNYFFVEYSCWFYLMASEVIFGNNLRKQSKEFQWILKYGAGKCLKRAQFNSTQGKTTSAKIRMADSERIKTKFNPWVSWKDLIHRFPYSPLRTCTSHIRTGIRS